MEKQINNTITQEQLQAFVTQFDLKAHVPAKVLKIIEVLQRDNGVINDDHVNAPQRTFKTVFIYRRGNTLEVVPHAQNARYYSVNPLYWNEDTDKVHLGQWSCGGAIIGLQGNEVPTLEEVEAVYDGIGEFIAVVTI